VNRGAVEAEASVGGWVDKGRDASVAGCIHMADCMRRAEVKEIITCSGFLQEKGDRQV